MRTSVLGWLRRATWTVLSAALILVPVVASVQTSHAAALHTHKRACTWSTSYWTKNGPPGAAQVTMKSISPSGCELYRMTIQSTGVPNVRYHSGWIGNPNISYINTCSPNPNNCPGSDGSTLNFAWEDRRPAGSTTWQCRGLFPVGQWVNCSTDSKERKGVTRNITLRMHVHGDPDPGQLTAVRPAA